MDETLTEAVAWMRAGQPVALATIIRTWGSAPRPAGAKMAVRGDGRVSGSVSAGCVETAVIGEGQKVLEDGRPRRLKYGVADETAWGFGLTCGGEIEIFVEPLAAGTPLAAVLESRPELPMARAVLIGGLSESLGRAMLFTGDGRPLGREEFELTPTLIERVKTAVRVGDASVVSLPLGAGEVEILVDPWLAPPMLVIIGAVHIARVLARLAQAVGYRVVVVEPRRDLAVAERFPEVEALEMSWPDEALRRIGLTPATAVAALSHDPKLDDPALLLALRSPAFYVGALGSQRTNDFRRERLLTAGLREEEIQRLHAPIGFDLGRQDPEGIALSILAEIVAARSGHAPRRGAAAGPVDRDQRSA